MGSSVVPIAVLTEHVASRGPWTCPSWALLCPARLTARQTEARGVGVTCPRLQRPHPSGPGPLALLSMLVLPALSHRPPRPRRVGWGGRINEGMGARSGLWAVNG